MTPPLQYMYLLSYNHLKCIYLFFGKIQNSNDNIEAIASDYYLPFMTIRCVYYYSFVFGSTTLHTPARLTTTSWKSHKTCHV